MFADGTQRIRDSSTMVEAPTTSGPKVGLLLLDTAEANEAPTGKGEI